MTTIPNHLASALLRLGNQSLPRLKANKPVIKPISDGMTLMALSALHDIVQ
eukprot:CAMPEP_0116136438 /NCGR_PEP_ID=MMETSP0329-20121206/11722_1 /TAXON_ID=697910 /ORGANISM="Pseudo-nitzschia arenysensis, Strain B593" /LENGTH=50 /DNA_ID=CAMNT_0003631301 /DNA_START=41 /DNA_END=191 /DNA_ORIENTATION=+